MDIIREQVCHQQFGIGTVISQTEDMIEVEFGKEYGIKKFIYPSVFEKYLTLSSKKLQNRMDYELHLIRRQEEAEKRRREQELQKQREEERLELLAQKRAEAGKKRTAAKSTAKSTVSVKK